MKRRALLASLSTAIVALSGCGNPDSSTVPAHTVSVYLTEREATRNVTVTVTDDSGETLFDREYALSDDNEADEDATFPASADPETVTVTVDDVRFERAWPGQNSPELPCDDPNSAGVELYIGGNPDEAPTLRLEANCQSVTMETSG